MSRRAVLVTMAAAVALCRPSLLQAQDDKLVRLIPNLFGPQGLVLDSEVPFPDAPHFAHFNASFQSEFTQFNVALASQLATLPLPSAASGFTYEFDPASGAFTRSTRSFGPIVAERAETVGRGRLAFGTTYQRFTFDSIEGLDLEAVPAVFTHDNATANTFRADVVTTRNAITTRFDQFTAFFTYGLTDRLDVAMAVPIVRAELGIASEATVHRLGSANQPNLHFFRAADGSIGDQRRFQAGGEASGLGDLIVRVKGTALRAASTAVGLGVDLRIPTGDEEDLLGTGAPGVKPFLALSFARGSFSPHVEVAYQWNGESVLAGDVLTGAKADLPDVLFYAAGLDVGVTRRVTLALALLGRRVSESPRLVRESFTALDGRSAFDSFRFENRSLTATDAAVGLKLNAVGKLLLDFNVLFKLDDAGLRDEVTPLLGLEYSF